MNELRRSRVSGAGIRGGRVLVAVAVAVAILASFPLSALSYPRPGRTERVSVASDGAEANSPSPFFFLVSPAISADGRHVAFLSEASNLVPGDTNRVSDVFVHDRATGTTERVSMASDGAEGNAPSYNPAISADGRYVAFMTASNLVPGDNNGSSDVFVHDRATGTTERVSMASDGAEANSTPPSLPPLPSAPTAGTSRS